MSKWVWYEPKNAWFDTGWKRINDYRYGVDVYSEHHIIEMVRFKRKWHAWLFHVLINKSLYHQGARRY